MAAKNPLKDMVETNNTLITTAKENYSKLNNNNSSLCNNMHIDHNAINENTTTKSESSTCCNPASLKVINKKTNSGIKCFDEPVIILDEDVTKNNEGTVSECKTMEIDKNESALHKTNQFLDKPSVCKSQSVAIDKNINNNQSKRKVKMDDNESPIVIEDNEKDNDCTIVESDKIISNNHSTRKTQSSLVKHYKKIYKENRLFTDIIERCLDMENTDGMLRIINRTLVPLYMDVDETRKKSSGFQKALFKAFRKIDNDPEKKFSHLKNLTIFLKTQKSAKTKVDIVPLKNFLNGTTKKKTSNLVYEIPPKRKKHDIIDLDDDNSDTDVQIKIIDVKGHVPEKNVLLMTSDNSNDRNEEQIVIDETETESNQNYEVINNIDQDDDVILVDAGNNNKENESMVKKNNKLIIQTQVRSDTSIANKAGYNINNDELLQIDLSDEPDQTCAITYFNGMKDYMAQDLILQDGSIEKKIQLLEEKLALYHKKVKELEETEVVEGFSSPYVECDMYKSHIVRLYKELCNLTGSVPVKRHKVRLKAVEGRHEGPMRCLEQFINDNIGEDGNPPFPDMHDVTDCVYKADSMYNMGWDKKKIEEEARALFIHYGRTVQKRRMKREWRYLMSYMKDDLPDPADEDAELQARLQRNKLIAMKNEEELLDRFVEEENSSTLRLSVDPNKNRRHQRISINNTKHTLITTVTNINTQSKDTPNTTTASSLNINSYENGSSGNITNNIMIYPLPAPIQYAIAPCVIGYNVVPNMVSTLPTLGTEVLLGNPDTSKNCPMHQNLGVTTNNSVITCAVVNGVISNLAGNPDTSKNGPILPNLGVNSNNGVFTCSVVNGVISNLAGIPDTSKNEPIQQNLGVNSNGVIGCSCSIMNGRISNLAGDSDASKNGPIQQNLEVTSNNSVMNCLVNKNITSSLAGCPGTSNNSIIHQNVEINSCGTGSVIDQISSNVASYAKVDIEVEDSDIPSTSKAHESIVNNTDGVSFLNNSDISKPCVIQNTETEASEVDVTNLPVKREPLDIPKMLYQLGSDYTATIIDIEDPFLVIEISDSSDSEDEPDDIRL